MKSQYMIVMVCLLPIGCSDSAPSDVPQPGQSSEGKSLSDSELLQGEWRLMSGEYGGKTNDRSQDSPPTTIRIEGDLLSEYVDGSFSTESRFTLDPDREPKRIALTYTDEKEVTEVGIYRVEGDTLTLCRTLPRNDYPDEFKTAEGDSRTLQVFHRVTE